MIVMAFFIASCSSVNESRLRFWGKTGGIERDAVKTFISSVRPNNGTLGNHYRFACFLKERRKYESAIAEFEKVLAINPGHVQSLNAMGICYDNLGDYSSAVKCYKRALEINPSLDYVYNNLGYSYLLSGKFDLAAKTLKKAVSLDDRKMRYRNNLDLAYLKTGKKTKDEFVAFRQDDEDKKTAAPEARKDEPSHNKVPEESKKTAAVPVAAPPLKAEPTSPSSRVENPVSPESIHSMKIEVSNGNGVPGMAAKVGAYLKRKNFSVTRLTNAANFGFGDTRLFYSPGYLHEAYELAKQIPGWQNMDKMSESGSSGIKVRLLLGRDLVRHKDLFFAETEINEACPDESTLLSYNNHSIITDILVE